MLIKQQEKHSAHNTIKTGLVIVGSNGHIQETIENIVAASKNKTISVAIFNRVGYVVALEGGWPFAANRRVF